MSMDITKAPSATIKLKGQKAAVDTAAEKLQETMERHKRENLTVTADPETIPALIGKGGANIRKLQVRERDTAGLREGTANSLLTFVLALTFLQSFG